MTKKYAYKGLNQDHETCEVCGKTDLKKVMWLIELDSDRNEQGEAFAAGTTCGAKLLGYSQNDFVKATKTAARLIERKKAFAYSNHPLMKEAQKIRTELQKKSSSRELRKSPEFIRTKEMMQQAYKESHSQSFTIEI